MNVDPSFIPNDATMQQMRSSGSLRYFKKFEFYMTITQYYNHCNYYNDVSKQRVKMPLSFQAKLFDAFDLAGFVTVTPDYRAAVHMSGSSPKLLTTDKQILNEYASYVSNEVVLNQVLLLILRSRIEKSLNKLMHVLQKEYDLK